MKSKVVRSVCFAPCFIAVNHLGHVSLDFVEFYNLLIYKIRKNPL